MGERGEVHGLRDKWRLVRLKEQWLHSIKTKRWERGNKEKEERGSCWTCWHLHYNFLGLRGEARSQVSIYHKWRRNCLCSGVEGTIRDRGKKKNMYLNVFIVLNIGTSPCFPMSWEWRYQKCSLLQVSSVFPQRH